MLPANPNYVTVSRNCVSSCSPTSEYFRRDVEAFLSIRWNMSMHGKGNVQSDHRIGIDFRVAKSGFKRSNIFYFNHHHYYYNSMDYEIYNNTSLIKR